MWGSLRLAPIMIVSWPYQIKHCKKSGGAVPPYTKSGGALAPLAPPATVGICVLELPFVHNCHKINDTLV